MPQPGQVPCVVTMVSSSHECCSTQQSAQSQLTLPLITMFTPTHSTTTTVRWQSHISVLLFAFAETLIKSMVQFKTVESPVHWSYCSLTLGHEDMHLWPMHGTCPPERKKGLVYIGLFEDRGHQGPYSHISTNPFNILTCLHNQICPPPLHSPINTVAFHMQIQDCSRLTHQYSGIPHANTGLLQVNQSIQWHSTCKYRTAPG